MRKTDTKERILDASLELFSSQGYEQTTMDNIADTVGIKAPSIYKHFSSKQEIFNSLIAKGEEAFYHFSLSMGITEDLNETAEELRDLDLASMKRVGLNLFDFLLHDPFTAQFRKMLAMRCYNDPELAEYYARFYLTQPMEYQGMVAAELARASGVDNPDTELLGLEFYSPIFLLISRCDAYPEYETEAKRLLEKHLDHFFANH